MCSEGAAQLAKALFPLRSTELEPISNGGSGEPSEVTSEVTSEVSSRTDTRVYHGTIITMAGGNLCPVEAMAVKGVKIVAVGSLEEVRSIVGPDDPVQDLGDRCIAPGFIDPHVHLVFSATVSKMIDFGPLEVTTLEQARDLVVAAAKRAKEHEWILGYGYDSSLVKGHPALTLHIMCDWARKNPVCIIDKTGHVAYINSTALEVSRIIQGNRSKNIVRDDHGNPTGILLEKAVSQMMKCIPPLQAQEMLDACGKCLTSWAAAGCTTVFDAAFGDVNGWGDIEIIKTLTSSPRSDWSAKQVAKSLTSSPDSFPRLRGAVAIWAIQDLVPVAEVLTPPPWYFGTTYVQAVKFWLDGELSALTAAVGEPYLGGEQSSNHGIMNYRDDELVDLAAVFFERWQIIMHANGDRAIDQALRVFKRLRDEYPLRNRSSMHRLEHVTMAKPIHMQQAEALGIGVSYRMQDVYYCGIREKLGTKRAERLDPVADAVNAGAVYSFHSDVPVNAVAPLLSVDIAMTRTLFQEPETILGRQQRVELTEALRAVTINPARQIGIDGWTGSLKAGKTADFVVLSKDPRTVPLGKLNEECQVLETWLEGKRIYPS